LLPFYSLGTLSSTIHTTLAARFVPLYTMASMTSGHDQDDISAELSSLSLFDRDARARENLNLIFKRIPQTHIAKPEILNIYHRPNAVTITNVPADIQLPVLFANWNEIADAAGVAKQDASTQDLTVARLIWHYGLDRHHNFTRHWSDTRYNIMLMAYAWATDFDESIYKPGVESFVVPYVEAWLSMITDVSRLD
jgi:hypothetical protein